MTRKCILILCVFLMGFGFLTAQNEAATAYSGLIKVIDVSSIYVPCDSIEIENISYTRDKRDPCTIRLQFEETGPLSVVFRKTDKTYLDTLEYDVLGLPDIRLEYALTVDGGEMTSDRFKIQLGPYPRHDSIGFNEKISLTSFKIELTRNKKRVFKRLNFGGIYNTEISTLLQKITDDDRVIFSDVYAEIEGFEPFLLPGMLIRIDDD